ncbi:hypothetical protein ACFQY4_27110 [Catellatospora bangladeshensis]|uniref:hypothetical protein n=1 Tax=Catellatospora bangladeshensis TaxID=310355 RepID=UPI00360DDAC7
MRARTAYAGGFALLGEVLLTGVAVALLALPVLTAPAALAAGIGHLRRYVDDQASPLSVLWRDARAAAAGGAAVALAALAGAAAAVFAIGLASADPTPAGTVMAAAGWLVLGIVATAVVMAAGSGPATAAGSPRSAGCATSSTPTWARRCTCSSRWCSRPC